MYATVSRGGGFCKWLRSYLVCVCVSIILCSYESCAPSSLLPRQSPSGKSSAGVDKRKLVYVQNISKQSILPSELCWFSLILCLLMYILFPLLPPLPSLVLGCIVGIAVLGTALCRCLAGSSCHLVLLQSTGATNRIKQVHG